MCFENMYTNTLLFFVIENLTFVKIVLQALTPLLTLHTILILFPSLLPIHDYYYSLGSINSLFRTNLRVAIKSRALK